MFFISQQVRQLLCFFYLLRVLKNDIFDIVLQNEDFFLYCLGIQCTVCVNANILFPLTLCTFFILLEFQIYHYLEKTVPPNWTWLKSQFLCILHWSYKEIVGISFDFWKSFYDKKEISSKVKLKVFASVLFLNCEKSYQTIFSPTILWCF